MTHAGDDAMKKKPVTRAAEPTYPTHAEAHPHRARWTRVLAIGVAAAGAASLAGCDTFDRLLGRDGGCDVPLGGVAPPLIENDPPARSDVSDDDDSAQPEEAATPATTATDEARPDGHVRDKIKMPE